MSFWDQLLEEAKSLGETLMEWAVLILIAIVVLVIGRWILRWVRKIIERVLDIPPLEALWDRSGITKALEPSNQSAASIVGLVAYAYLMVGLWLIVARILRLDPIEDLLTRLIAWIPNLVVAAAIVIIAAAAASWVADLIRPFASNRGVPWLTWIVQVSVIVFGLLFAMDLLEVSFAEDFVKIAVAAAGIALAIAFGVGGIDTAKLWWSKYGAPGSSSGQAQHSGTQHSAYGDHS